MRKWRVIVFNEPTAQGSLALMKDGRPHERVELANGRLRRTRELVPRFASTRLGHHVEICAPITDDDLGPIPAILEECTRAFRAGEALRWKRDEVPALTSDTLQELISAMTCAQTLLDAKREK